MPDATLSDDYCGDEEMRFSHLFPAGLSPVPGVTPN